MVRNIDYKAVSKANEVSRKMYRKSAIINALRENNPNKAELLSEKPIFPKPSPEQIIAKDQAIKQQSEPIIKVLKDVGVPKQQSSESVQRGQQTEPQDLDVGIDEDLIQNHGLIMPSTLLQQDYDTKTLRSVLSEARQLKNEYSRKIGSVRRTQDYKQASSEDKKFMTKDLEREREVMQQYLSAVQSMSGKGIMTSMGDVINRFKLLVGHIQAGNTNKNVLNEAAEIAHFLYSKKKLTKGVYQNLISSIYKQ
jgi:hypothetical protein